MLTNRDIKISDLIMTGIIAELTVNKGLVQTVNTNTLGGYYSSQINNNDNPALSALYFGGALAVGYKVCTKFTAIFNKAPQQFVVISEFTNQQGMQKRSLGLC